MVRNPDLEQRHGYCSESSREENVGDNDLHRRLLGLDWPFPNSFTNIDIVWA